jgi:hypothetical protein
MNLKPGFCWPRSNAGTLTPVTSPPTAAMLARVIRCFGCHSVQTTVVTVGNVSTDTCADQVERQRR